MVKSPKTVKYAKNTTCDTCSMNSGRYKICDIFPHTVVITVKRSNQQKTQFVILVHNTCLDMRIVIILLIQLNYAVKRSNPLKTCIVLLVHRACADMRFVTFFFIQL